eukprot:scaffold923_cov256-Pinguiococcus_pyrenoidosus.AAC.49
MDTMLMLYQKATRAAICVGDASGTFMAGQRRRACASHSARQRPLAAHRPCRGCARRGQRRRFGLGVTQRRGCAQKSMARTLSRLHAHADSQILKRGDSGTEGREGIQYFGIFIVRYNAE